MANRGFFKKILIPVTHLPSVLLGIGYVIFWIELFFLNKGKGTTTPLSSCVFGLFAVWVIWQRRGRAHVLWVSLREVFLKAPFFERCFWGAGLFFTTVILLISLHAALLPPHLIQETDLMSYHLTVPRQHLLRASFAHIRWSTADFYLLPLEFALSPYWFVTALPNKFPQFLFLLGLLGVAARLTARFTKGDLRASLVAVFALIGLHALSIQAGTGMLDIPIAFLAVAAVDSFLDRRPVLCALEASFYVWSKSFIPLEFILVGAVLLVLALIVRRCRLRCAWLDTKTTMTGMDFQRPYLKRTVIGFVLFSLFVGGPFLVKDLYYTGTPLFPFAVGDFYAHPQLKQDPVAWRSLQVKAANCLAIRDQYGSGRSPWQFIKQLWLIAVPEKGVNNRYDYPLGLVYLLFLAPFAAEVIRSLRRRVIPFIPLTVTVLWFLWWMGSQQSRFLYVPLVLLILTVAVRKEYHSSILKGGIVLALMLTAVSVFRAQRADFGKWGMNALRPQDARLVAMGKKVPPEHVVRMKDYAVAFADFPVEVIDNQSPYVLNFSREERP